MDEVGDMSGAGDGYGVEAGLGDVKVGRDKHACGDGNLDGHICGAGHADGVGDVYGSGAVAGTRAVEPPAGLGQMDPAWEWGPGPTSPPPVACCSWCSCRGCRSCLASMGLRRRRQRARRSWSGTGAWRRFAWPPHPPWPRLVPAWSAASQPCCMAGRCVSGEHPAGVGGRAWGGGRGWSRGLGWDRDHGRWSGVADGSGWGHARGRGGVGVPGAVGWDETMPIGGLGRGTRCSGSG